MTLDCIVLGLVLFFALLGLAAGGLLQISHLAALGVGGLISRPLGLRLGPLAAHHFKVPQLIGIAGVTVAAFFVLYALVQILLRVLLTRTLENPRLGKADHLAGFVLGGAKAAVIVYVMLSALTLFEKPLASLSPTLHFDTRGSRIAELVRGHDLFSEFSFPGVKGIGALARAARDPAAAAQLAQDPQLQALAHDPRVRRILSDGSLQHALQTGDYLSVLRSSRVMEALSDPELQGKLVRVGEALPQASGKLPAK